MYLFIALVLALALNALQLYFNKKEVRELHIKLASKSLAEAEYYLKEYPKALRQGEKQLKEKIKAEKNMTDEEREIAEKSMEF